MLWKNFREIVVLVLFVWQAPEIVVIFNFITKNLSFVWIFAGLVFG